MPLTWIIARREIIAYARQRRTLIAMIVLAAILANAGRAVVFVSPLVRMALITRHDAAIHLSGHHDLAQAALVWIGMLPVLFSAQQAAITIAAERERRSLTALLVSPVAVGAILCGKLIGSLAPGLLMLVVSYAVYFTSIAASTPDAAAWLPASIVAAVFALMLATSALMNAVALLISAYSPTVSNASITATFVLLPVSFGVAGLSVKVSDFGPSPIAALACAGFLLTGLVLFAASRLVQRGGLLIV
jgi:ABC-type Na+ efflux pump permease subunit